MPALPVTLHCQQQRMLTNQIAMSLCLAADIVLFRDPLDPAVNLLAGAEVYMSIDVAPTGPESAGIVNSGLIGMQDGPVVRLSLSLCDTTLLSEVHICEPGDAGTICVGRPF